MGTLSIFEKIKGF